MKYVGSERWGEWNKEGGRRRGNRDRPTEREQGFNFLFESSRALKILERPSPESAFFVLPHPQSDI